MSREVLFNQEAEQSVIGSIVYEPELIKDCSLTSKHFYLEVHQIIFGVMKELETSNIPIDLISLSKYLGRDLEKIGGTSHLTKLAESVPSTANFNYYCRLVLEHSKIRKALQAANKLQSEVLQNRDLSIVSEIVRELTSLDDADDEDEQELKEILMELYEEMENDTGELSGVDTGYKDLNQVTNGLKMEDMIVVGARPSMGKTAFCLNVGQNAAEKGGSGVGVFSLEMGKKQLLRRMVSATGRIDASKMRTPGRSFGETEWNKTGMAMGAIQRLPLKIWDKAGVDIGYIWSKTRKFARSIREQEPGKPIIIIIDYLQLIVGNPKHGGNRTAEISEISRMLKTMARELKVCVIALSQLSRAVEQRQDKRPMMSDLRESGQIEQDADIIAFLYREDYYDKETEEKNIIEIIIAKHRNGPTGTVKLAFLKEYNKFVSLDYSHQGG